MTGSQFPERGELAIRARLKARRAAAKKPESLNEAVSNKMDEVLAKRDAEVIARLLAINFIAARPENPDMDSVVKTAAKCLEFVSPERRECNKTDISLRARGGPLALRSGPQAGQSLARDASSVRLRTGSSGSSKPLTTGYNFRTRQGQRRTPAFLNYSRAYPA
jgi:hypothetical protein